MEIFHAMAMWMEVMPLGSRLILEETASTTPVPVVKKFPGACIRKGGNGTDAPLFKSDFGRSAIQNP